MSEMGHIKAQGFAVGLITILGISFILSLGLEFTYGESPLWVLITFPLSYWVGRRVMHWHYKKAVEKYVIKDVEKMFYGGKN